MEVLVRCILLPESASLELVSGLCLISVLRTDDGADDPSLRWIAKRLNELEWI